MSEVWNPHDRLFKEIWSDREAATDFLGRYFPEGVRRLVELDTLEICKDSFVTGELREYFSDLLYRVSMNGRDSYLYLLLEHKSWAHRTIALQLLGYIKGIWDLHLKQVGLPLPPVIPFVLYHGREGWHVSESMMGLLGDVDSELQVYIPDFRYQLIDLSSFEDEEIKGHVLIKVGLLLLKHVFRQDYREKIPEVLKLLRELVEKKTGMQYIETVLRYIFHTVEGMGVDDLRPIVEENLSEEKGGWIMTLAEKVRNEGIEQGIQQGLLEGITALIEIKFGESGLKLLPALRKIRNADRLREIKDAIRVVLDVREVEKMLYH
jgi:predicted transposase/invertase (TIGR01784 family)